MTVYHRRISDIHDHGNDSTVLRRKGDVHWEQELEEDPELCSADGLKYDWKPSIVDAGGL